MMDVRLITDADARNTDPVSDATATPPMTSDPSKIAI